MNYYQDKISIGVGSKTSDDAILEISSTSGALLLPRLENPSDDVSSPINGMLAYNATDNTLQGYEDNTWSTYFGVDPDKLADTLYFVHPNGSTSGVAGVLLRPFDLPTAISLTSVGDTIIFISGDYGDIDYDMAVNGIAYRTLGSVSMNLIDNGHWDFSGTSVDIQGDFNISINKTWDGVSIDVAFGIRVVNSTSCIISGINFDLITGESIIIYDFSNTNYTMDLSYKAISDDGYILRNNGNSLNILKCDIIAEYTGNRDIQPIQLNVKTEGIGTASIELQSQTGGIKVGQNVNVNGNIIQGLNGSMGISVFSASSKGTDIYANITGGTIYQAGNLQSFNNFYGKISDLNVGDNANGSKYRFFGEVSNIILLSDNDEFYFINTSCDNIYIPSSGGVIYIDNSTITDLEFETMATVTSPRLKFYSKNSNITLKDNTKIPGDTIATSTTIIDSTITGNNGDDTSRGLATIVEYGGANNSSLSSPLYIKNSTIINNSIDSFASSIFLYGVRPNVITLDSVNLETGGEYDLYQNGGQQGFIDIIGDVTLSNGYILNEINSDFRINNRNSLKIRNKSGNVKIVKEITTTSDTLHSNDSGYTFISTNVSADIDITLDNTLPIGYTATVIKYNSSIFNLNFISDGTSVLSGIVSSLVPYVSFTIIKTTATDFIISISGDEPSPPIEIELFMNSDDAVSAGKSIRGLVTVDILSEEITGNLTNAYYQVSLDGEVWTDPNAVNSTISDLNTWILGNITTEIFYVRTYVIYDVSKFGNGIVSFTYS